MRGTAVLMGRQEGRGLSTYLWRDSLPQRRRLTTATYPTESVMAMFAARGGEGQEPGSGAIVDPGAILTGCACHKSLCTVNTSLSSRQCAGSASSKMVKAVRSPKVC